MIIANKAAGVSDLLHDEKLWNKHIRKSIDNRESVILIDSVSFAPPSEFLNAGYSVKTFDITRPKHSNSWDMLSEARKGAVRAAILADIICEDIPFMYKTASFALVASALTRAALDNEFTKQGANGIMEVNKILMNAADEEYTRELFNPESLGDGARSSYLLYNIFWESPEYVRGKAVELTTKVFEPMVKEPFCKMVNKEDIDTSLPVYKPCAYFITLPPDPGEQDIILRLFIPSLFMGLEDGYDSEYMQQEKTRVKIYTDFCKGIKRYFSINAGRAQSLVNKGISICFPPFGG